MIREKQKFNANLLYIIGFMMIVQACSTSREVSYDRGGDGMSPLSVTQVQPGDTTYQIRPGDEIELLVWEQPSFNTLTSVSRLGTVAIPLLGEVVVAGLTKDELERNLKRDLTEYIRGEINLTVSIRNTDDLLVSVFGMVERPDNYPIVDQTTIFRILSTAGGPTEFANMSKVKLYRQTLPGNYVTLDLLDYLESGQMDSPTIVVRPGDIIYVPRKNNAVRDMSEFLRDVVILFGIFRVFS